MEEDEKEGRKRRYMYVLCCPLIIVKLMMVVRMRMTMGMRMTMMRVINLYR